MTRSIDSAYYSIQAASLSRGVKVGQVSGKGWYRTSKIGDCKGLVGREVGRRDGDAYSNDVSEACAASERDIAVANYRQHAHSSQSKSLKYPFA